MACRPTLFAVQGTLAVVIGIVGTLVEGPGSSEASQYLIAVQDARVAVQELLAAAIMVGMPAEGQAPNPVDTV
jgi:hypothetical protein